MTNQTNLVTAPRTVPAPALASTPVKGPRHRAVLLATALLAASVAACAPTAPSGPIDVGNMAFPNPVAQGNLGTSALSGRQVRDTGNMAYPDALPQGNLGITGLSGRQALDTGNMAYPAPSPVGNVATTVVR